MSGISSEEIRKLRDEFWIKQNHKIATPVSIIPDSTDKTVIFNTSGMQQLVPYLTGKEHPHGKKLYNIQKCVRTNDIDDIGDERHLSFFEMMGNRSLGDYFKKESLTWSIEFLTKYCKIPLEKIGATIFVGNSEIGISEDTEAKAILNSLGIPDERIRKLDEDNFRGPPGKIGPCGPSCEIHVDRGDNRGPADRNMGSNDRYTEIWNNVFMEFYKGDEGFIKLKQQNVDTGMGLERLIMILNNKPTIFETDLFEDILKEIELQTGQKYPPFNGDTSDNKTTKSFRIITDHIRSTCIMIADGVNPSNEGRGYVLRRIIRRMVFHILLLNEKFNELGNLKNIISKLSEIVVRKFGNVYTNLNNLAFDIIQKEGESFLTTIKKGLKLLDEKLKNTTDGKLSGKDAFELYDTYGFPYELTKEICDSLGKKVDEQGYLSELEKAKEQSRQNASNMFTKDVDRASYVEGIPATKFVGYEQFESEGKLLKRIDLQDYSVLIFDQTPFYPEGGGQTGDKGSIIMDDGQVKTVFDVKKYVDIILHFIK